MASLKNAPEFLRICTRQRIVQNAQEMQLQNDSVVGKDKILLHEINLGMNTHGKNQMHVLKRTGQAQRLRQRGTPW